MDVAPRLQTLRVEEPPKRGGGGGVILLGSAAELVQRLRHEARVIT